MMGTTTDETPVVTLPDLYVVRTALIPVGLRPASRAEGDEESDDAAEADNDTLGVLDVRFSPFNTWYEINSFWEGSFIERTVPGAFKATINSHNAAQTKDAHRIRSMFNHGMDMHIDQKLLGDVFEAAEESDSPRIGVNLWDTSYNRDLLPGLKRGTYGSSFMFQTIRDEWDHEPEKSSYNPKGLPERTLKEVRVFEAGPVTWPASPTASAGMRCFSATDRYYEDLAKRDPDTVRAMRSRLLELRTSSTERAGREATRPDDDAATTPQTAPASRHSGSPTPRQRREAIYPYLRSGERA
jgi:phage head maturation protease